MESKCFNRCIRKPGIQAEKSEEVTKNQKEKFIQLNLQGCLVKCMDRFMESWSVVGETVAHIQSKINESQIQQQEN